jgi:hypothetical protein
VLKKERSSSLLQRWPVGCLHYFMEYGITMDVAENKMDEANYGQNKTE